MPPSHLCSLQVVLGVTLTALGAGKSSHVLITIFGVMNTIIAGLAVYLKSRGQPMRARMYRDDTNRVVDEIENSEVMWLGISRGVLGYDQINPDEVTANAMSNPDMYMSGGGLVGTQTGLRPRLLPSQPTVPVNTPDPTPDAPLANTPAAVDVPVAGAPLAPDPDESPAAKAEPTRPAKGKSSKAPKDAKSFPEDQDHHQAIAQLAILGSLPIVLRIPKMNRRTNLERTLPKLLQVQKRLQDFWITVNGRIEYIPNFPPIRGNLQETAHRVDR